MTTKSKGKALIEQQVTVDFVVRLEADESDLTMTVDELQERIIEHVKKEFLGQVITNAVADIYARRGPGGYRYFPPEAVAEGFKYSKPDDRAASPVTVTLSDLGYPEED